MIFFNPGAIKNNQNDKSYRAAFGFDYPEKIFARWKKKNINKKEALILFPQSIDILQTLVINMIHLMTLK